MNQENIWVKETVYWETYVIVNYKLITVDWRNERVYKALEGEAKSIKY